MLSIPAPVAVTGTEQLACAIPPGVSTIVLSCTGSQTVYIGTSSGVTASGGGEGFPLPAGATVTITTHPGSTGGSLYVIASTTGSNLGIIISTAQ